MARTLKKVAIFEKGSGRFRTPKIGSDASGLDVKIRLLDVKIRLSDASPKILVSTKTKKGAGT